MDYAIFEGIFGFHFFWHCGADALYFFVTEMKKYTLKKKQKMIPVIRVLLWFPLDFVQLFFCWKNENAKNTFVHKSSTICEKAVKNILHSYSTNYTKVAHDRVLCVFTFFLFCSLCVAAVFTDSHGYFFFVEKMYITFVFKISFFVKKSHRF